MDHVYPFFNHIGRKNDKMLVADTRIGVPRRIKEKLRTEATRGLSSRPRLSPIDFLSWST